MAHHSFSSFVADTTPLYRSRQSHGTGARPGHGR